VPLIPRHTLFFGPAFSLFTWRIRFGCRRHFLLLFSFPVVFPHARDRSTLVQGPPHAFACSLPRFPLVAGGLVWRSGIHPFFLFDSVVKDLVLHSSSFFGNTHCHAFFFLSFSFWSRLFGAIHSGQVTFFYFFLNRVKEQFVPAARSAPIPPSLFFSFDIVPQFALSPRPLPFFLCLRQLRSFPNSTADFHVLVSV